MKKLSALIIVCLLSVTPAFGFGDNNNNHHNNNTTNEGGAGGEGGKGGKGGEGGSAHQGQQQGQSQIGINTNKNMNKATAIQGQQQGNTQGTAVSIGGDTYKASDLSRRVPDVSAPHVSAPRGSCIVYLGLGLGLPGGGGSGGIPVGKDEDCRVRNQSLMLYGLGLRAAAIARACDIEEVAAAIHRTGGSCPDVKAKKKPSNISFMPASFEVEVD